MSGFAFAVGLCRGAELATLDFWQLLDEALLAQTVTLSDTLSQTKEGVTVHEFDLISGLTGVGVYLFRPPGEP